MDNWILQTGLAGLFLISFLAATLLPLGSEAAVLLLAASGFDPMAVLVAASSGNILGATVNYGVGRWGRQKLNGSANLKSYHRWIQAENAVRRWGSPILFFSWAPFIGDPLTVLAGVLKIGWIPFLFWVSLGKTLRYGLLLSHEFITS
ncbi:MAG: YqaA family protein [Desulfatirhabdiaceae bacterium]